MEILQAKDIIYMMDQWAKPELIDTWDNTGFQIGNENQEVGKVLIALDLDRKVLDYAIKNNYNMIITHHPIIFKPLNQIIYTNYKESIIIDLIKNNIIAYNAHSNLDLANNGVSHALAEVLEIKNTRSLNTIYSHGNEIYGYGQIGEMESMSTIELISLIKNKLEINQILIYGEIKEDITKVAVCGGSGSDFIYDAFNKGAQVYITGDIKYHDAQLAEELGIIIIDAGHFNTEKVILPKIQEYLNCNFQDKLKTELIYESSIPFKIV